MRILLAVTALCAVIGLTFSAQLITQDEINTIANNRTVNAKTAWPNLGMTIRQARTIDLSSMTIYYNKMTGGQYTAVLQDIWVS